jgi:ATP-binding cassette subfamily F protein 3
MVKLMLEPVNFLVMDEPTNHLDMRSKEILKQALNDFTGTLLLVSHDRDFLNGLVTSVYEFGNKKVKQHLGGIYDFIEKKKIANLNELEAKSVISKEIKSASPKASNTNELSFEEKKEINRQMSRIEKLIEQCEHKISTLEDELEVVSHQLSNPENPDHSLFERYNELKKLLESSMAEWELLHEQLDEWKIKKTW